MHVYCVIVFHKCSKQHKRCIALKTMHCLVMVGFAQNCKRIAFSDLSSRLSTGIKQI